jgi:hypothetical protein
MASLYATAGCNPRLVEVGVFNSTATAVVIALQRLTTAGTQGTGQTEAYVDDDAATILGTVFDLHSSTPPTLGGKIRQAPLGAAIGSGIIWTFGDCGLIIPAGTGNGMGIICATGTSQICDVYFEWIE